MSFRWIVGRATLMVAFTLAFGLALACSQSTETGDGAEASSALDADPTPPADSAAPSRVEEAVTRAASEAAAKLADATAEHPSVSSCLDLVKAGQFAEAISPCTDAVRRAPENQEVATALEEAKSGSMDAAAAGAAAADGLGDRLP